MKNPTEDEMSSYSIEVSFSLKMEWNRLILFPKSLITRYLVKTDQLAKIGFFSADPTAVGT